MSPGRDRRKPDASAELRRYFDELAPLGPAQRGARLEELRRAAPELATQLSSLLEADDRAEQILSSFERGLPGRPPSLDDPLGLVGQVVSHFRVSRLLGAGGMGLVYAAEDVRLGRTVALKFPAPRLAPRGTTKERFLQEARSASGLDHPTICTIYEAGETEDGLLFLAMAYYEGETLRERLELGPLPVDESVRIATEVARGLEFAHDAGILHRDIKPANLMLTRTDEVKILDFGLARLKDVSVDGPLSTAGTLAYMAPEQLRGGTLDERTDLWALGVVLYEMLTGRRPFRVGDRSELLGSIGAGAPGPPGAYRPDLPTSVERIVERLLRADSVERFADAGSLIDVLTPIAAPARAGPPTRKRGAAGHSRRWIYAAVAVAAIALGGVVISSSNPTLEIGSLAVLPFTALASDSTEEYFVQGMQASLITELSKRIDVISQRSAMDFGDRRLSAQDIGEALDVDALVDASVLLFGDSAEVNVHLVDVSGGRNFWTESYRVSRSGLADLHRDVAETIADEIGLSPNRAEATRRSAPRRVDPDAYDLYLRGRFHWNRRTDDGFRRAVDYFERAIEVDPDYAAAHAGLSDAYNLLGQYGHLPLEQARPLAREAAERAVALDGTLAAALTARAEIHFLDREWTDAERLYRAAIRQNPGYATGHHFYGWFLTHLGRHSEAIRELESAADLDPLSAIIGGDLAMAYYHAGRVQDAAMQARRTLEFQPGFQQAEWAAILALAARGALPDGPRPVRALESFHDPLIRAHVLALLGRRAEADSLVRSTIRKAGGVDEIDPHRAMIIAVVELAVGRDARGLDWLERAVERGAASGAVSFYSPLLDPVRAYPRFRQLQRRMDFPG